LRAIGASFFFGNTQGLRPALKVKSRLPTSTVSGLFAAPALPMNARTPRAMNAAPTAGSDRILLCFLVNCFRPSKVLEMTPSKPAIRTGLQSFKTIVDS
jgi:hypothetical protein